MGWTETCDRETVDLRRVDRVSDLWTAIEAAQYARVVLHDPLDDTDGAEAISAFVDAFASAAEQWETGATRNIAPLLASIDARLSDLGRLGLFVHWGCLERVFEDDEDDDEDQVIPVAVISVDRHDLAEQRLVLPGDLLIALHEEERDD